MGQPLNPREAERKGLVQPHTEIEEVCQKLGDLEAWIALRHSGACVLADQFKKAFKQSLQSNRNGKVLFKFA